MTDVTARLGCRTTTDGLGTLVDEGNLGRRVANDAVASTENEGA